MSKVESQFVSVLFADRTLAFNFPLPSSVSIIIRTISLNYNLKCGYLFTENGNLLHIDKKIEEGTKTLIFSSSVQSSIPPGREVRKDILDIQTKGENKSKLSKILDQLQAKKNILKFLIGEEESTIQNSSSSHLHNLLIGVQRAVPKKKYLSQLGIKEILSGSLPGSEFEFSHLNLSCEASMYNILDTSCPGVSQKAFTKSGSPTKQSTIFPMFYESMMHNAGKRCRDEDFSKTNELDSALTRGFTRINCCLELYGIFHKCICFIEMSSGVLSIDYMGKQENNHHGEIKLNMLSSDDVKLCWNAISHYAIKEPEFVYTSAGLSLKQLMRSLNWSWWQCLVQPLDNVKNNVFRILPLNSQPGSITLDSCESSLVVKLHSETSKFLLEVQTLQRLSTSWKESCYVVSYGCFDFVSNHCGMDFFIGNPEATTNLGQRLLNIFGLSERVDSNTNKKESFIANSTKYHHVGFIIMKFGFPIDLNMLNPGKALSDLSKTCYALQKFELCHTDIRLQNILYFPQIKQYQLIDYDRVLVNNTSLSIAEEVQFRLALPPRIKSIVERWESNECDEEDSIKWTILDDFMMLHETLFSNSQH